jgi:hypothetical protein
MMISRNKYRKYKIELFDISNSAELTVYLSLDGSSFDENIEDAIQFVMGEKDYTVISIESIPCIVHIHIDEFCMGPN